MQQVYIEIIKQLYKILFLAKRFEDRCRATAIKYIYFSESKGSYFSAKLDMKYPENISVGDNCTVGACTIGAHSHVAIGNNVTISQDALIETASLSRNTKARHKSAPIVIEDDVWVCARASVLGGSVVKKGSVVPAGHIIKGVYENVQK